jgi:hypothetical protein
LCDFGRTRLPAERPADALYATEYLQLPEGLCPRPSRC